MVGYMVEQDSYNSSVYADSWCHRIDILRRYWMSMQGTQNSLRGIGGRGSCTFKLLSDLGVDYVRLRYWNLYILIVRTPAGKIMNKSSHPA